MAADGLHRVGRIMTSDERSIRLAKETDFSLFPMEVRRSAFSISDRHVLTAGHCVRSAVESGTSRERSPIWFRIRTGDRPATFRYIPMVLLKIDVTRDVAVLGIDEPRLEGARVTPEEARAILRRSAIPLRAVFDRRWPVSIAGFPEGRSASDSTALSADSGPILAMLGDAELIQVQVSAFAAANPDFAYGMSGGPVLADAPDGLCAIGVLKGVPAGSDDSGPRGGMVLATPISMVLDIDEIGAAIRKPRAGIARRLALAAAGAAVVGVAATVADKLTSTSAAGSAKSGIPTTTALGEPSSSPPGSAPLRRAPSAGLKAVTPTAVLAVPGPAYALAFATGDDLLAAGGGDNRISLWHTSADLSRPSATAATGATVQSLAFQPGGGRIASGQDNGIRLWDTSKPGRITPVGGVFGASGGSAFTVAFSPDGTTLATGYSNNDISLWDTSAPGPAGALGGTGDHRGAVTGVAFGPANDLLASCSYDTTIRLWKISEHGDLRQIAAMSPNTSAMLSVAFSPDGSCLVSGGKDGNVRFWNIGKPSSPVQIVSGAIDVGPIVSWVAFSRDWIVAAGCDDGTVYLWDASDPSAPKEIGRHPQVAFPAGSSMHVVGFGSAGRLVGAAASDGPNGSGGAVVLWRLA